MAPALTTDEGAFPACRAAARRHAVGCLPGDHPSPSQWPTGKHRPAGCPPGRSLSTFNSQLSTRQLGRRQQRRNPQLSTRRWPRRRAFTLLEVVISVGIFAGAIVIALAILGPLNRSIGEVADNGRAARLAGAINAELLRLRDVQAPPSGPKLDALADLVKNGAVLRLVASTDGSRVVWETDAGNDPVNPGAGKPPGIARRDRYYLIEVRNQPAPLNYTVGSSAFLALTATIRWPYQVATGPGSDDATAADLTQTQTLQLNYALPP